MSIGARCGFFVLLFGFLVGTAALAEDATPSKWTEPPVRGASGPQGGETAKPPPDLPAKPAAEAPAPVEPSGKAASRDNATSVDATKSKAAAEAKPTRQSAKLRRLPIRREAARTRGVAEAPRHGRVYAEEAPRYRAQRHAFARQRAVRPTYAYRAYPVPPNVTDELAADDETLSYRAPYRARRAGWDGLLGDSRARRIAEARASGYIVMRARSVEYPDGTRLHSLRPYESDPLD